MSPPDVYHQTPGQNFAAQEGTSYFYLHFCNFSGARFLLAPFCIPNHPPPPTEQQQILKMSFKKIKENQKSVLLLGCGLVAPPLINYLANNDIHVVVASRTLSRSEGVVAGLANTTPIEFDIEADGAIAKLDELVPQVDLVISLLPYIHHPTCAEVAIKHKKHFCTTSYESDAIRELATAAEEAGVIILNECGVDPGLDHMSAQKVIDEVHSQGGKIISFTSICGGLPSPKDNDNPFGYKLSWAPRGVLLASRNSAKILRDGKVKDVSGLEVFASDNVTQEDFEGEKGFNQLEWYYNRDSVKYVDIYGVQEAKTVIRGTYRYAGWCETLVAMAKSGLTSLDEVAGLAGKTVLEVAAIVGGVSANDGVDAVKAGVAAAGGVAVDSDVISRLEWVGLFSSDIVVPAGIKTVLDVMCFLFQAKLVYQEGEKDAIVMRHTFDIEFSNSRREQRTSTLIDFGQQPDGFSSMSRTVSLPLAVAVRKILNREITLSGLYIPVIPELYNPILEEMAELGVVFEEKTLPQEFWVRSEVKPGEERVAITPENTKKLLDAGFRVKVERSPHRCIKDEEYEKVGATLVPTETWPTAPRSSIILGLKELPESNEPLVHRHIYFAHCFKNQDGWKEILTRFTSGGGLLWDLEFLKFANGRRVAAFGRPAGVAGMAVGLLAWAHQKLGTPVPAPLTSWPSALDMAKDIKAKIDEAVAKTGASPPTSLVLGALGRCGGGAVWFAEQCGIAPVQWDMEETKTGAPFKEMVDVDVLVNCIYLTGKIDPFVTDALVDAEDRKLAVFVDVSCDYTNPENPFPIYKQGTTFFDPIVRIRDGDKPVDVVAIDHLPSLIPVESSEGFSDDLTPHLLALISSEQSPVWTGAEDLFKEKVALL